MMLIFTLLVSAQDKKDPLFEETEFSLNHALDESADMFFPLDYERSSEHYKSAVKLLSEKQNYSEIRKELESSIAILTTVNERVEAVKNFFEDVIKERKTALDKGAGKYAVALWNDAEESFKEAISDYDENDLEDASAAIPDIIKPYQKSEMYADKATDLLNNWPPVQNADNSTAFLLSPEDYSEGMEFYSNALEKISNGDDVDDISDEVASARTHFVDAEKVAKSFSSKYPESIKARNDARQSEAETYVAEEWLNAEKSLKSAGEEFEDKNYEDVLEYVDAAFQHYIIAKRLAIKNKYLFVSREKIEEAKNLDAEEYAPKTYSRSLTYLHQAERLIDSGNYLDSEVKQITGKCEAEASLASEISRMILRVENGDRTLEDLILALKSQSGLKPVVMQPTKVESKKTIEKPKTRTTWLGTNIYDLFGSDEVEVSENENKTTIRLFNLGFAWVSYKLNDQSKDVLNRLIPVLEKFDNSMIQIASYTDNVAASRMNNEVSEKRAENIMNYLLEHSTLSQSKLSSVGYGESNPIADNHTIEGRRKNNRVEIVISK